MKDYKCAERVTMETRAVSAGDPTLVTRCSAAPRTGRVPPKAFSAVRSRFFEARSRELDAALGVAYRLATVSWR